MKRFLILLPALLLAPLEAAEPAASGLFHDFAAAPKPGEGTVLPDYSHAGYHGNARPLPPVSPDHYRVFNVCDFGAVPNDSRSDRDAVLKAVDAAQNQPGPAMIYFPPGRYRLNEKSDLGKPGIVISRSNIVLKGSGMAETELFFAEPCLCQSALLLFRDPTWLGIKTDRSRDDYTIRGFLLGTVKTFPPRGAFALEVEPADKIKPGMVVTLNAALDGNSEAGRRYYAPHEVLPGSQGPHPYIFEVHRVKAVAGRLVTFEEPIQYDFPNYAGAKLYEIKNLEEVGLEDLTLCGNNRELFYHHMGSRDQSGYALLNFHDVINGWVRNVRFRNYGEAFKVERGGFNTFMNLVFEGNAGHLLAGAYGGSYGNLYGFNRELAPTWHGPIGNGGADTVALRSLYFGNMEMHCGFSRGTLMDDCEGNFSYLRGGGAKFAPHQGEYNCYWNWRNTRPGKVDFWPTGSTYGYMMPPIIAGLHGEPCEIAKIKTDTLAVESLGTPVNPESLFEAQLALRQGSAPAWLSEESRRFNTVSRFSTIGIRSPASHSQWPAGRPLPIVLDLDPQLAAKDVRKIRIQASSESLDSGFRVLQELEQAPFAGEVTLAPGTWVLTASLINSRGEICESRPAVVFIDNGQPWRPVRAIRSASFLEDGLKEKAIALGLHVDGKGNLLQKIRADHPGLADHELDLEFEAASLAAYQAGVSMMTAEHAAKDNPRIAAQVIDGNRSTPLNTKAGYKRTFLFELPVGAQVCRMDLCFDRELAGAEYKVELMGSNDPRGWFTYLNDEGFWEPALVRNGQSRIGYLAVTRQKRLTFYFPGRSYRYLRLIAPAINLGRLTEVEFFGKGE